MKKTWTEQEALELIEKVEAEFMAHLADMEPLNKSEAKAEDEKKDAKKEESKAEEMDKCGDMAMKRAEDEQPAAEQSAESEETIEDLYRSMSDEERKAHYYALKK